MWEVARRAGGGYERARKKPTVVPMLTTTPLIMARKSRSMRAFTAARPCCRSLLKRAETLMAALPSYDISELVIKDEFRAGMAELRAEFADRANQ